MTFRCGSTQFGAISGRHQPNGKTHRVMKPGQLLQFATQHRYCVDSNEEKLWAWPPNGRKGSEEGSVTRGKTRLRKEKLLRFFGLRWGQKTCDLFYESSALTN